MTKAGIVKAKFSRRPQGWWKLKRITVDWTKTGKYYCSILYEVQEKEPKAVITTEETTIGLKYSMAHFYVADNGDMADPPRWLQRSQEKLADIQRRLSRMEAGSKNYQEMVQKYRELHEHIANQRRDFIHKESRRIANAWDAVCVRADDLKAIARGLVRGNVLDSGYGMFRNCLRYKLERQGKLLILVDRYAPTSRNASPHQREVSAAKNIKALGLAQYFACQEVRESA